MKSIQCGILASLLFAGGSLYGQLSKQYADSARIFVEQRKDDMAIDYFLKSLKELKKDSMTTAGYALNEHDLANVYYSKGDLEKAEPTYLDSKAIWEKVLGKDNLSYASSCFSLGRLYNRMGQFEKAEMFYLESKQVREKLLGKEHPDYLAICAGLGNVYKNTMNYKKAEELFLERKQITEKVFGKENTDYASSCYSLGVLYGESGEFEKAVKYSVESRNLRRKLVGEEHQDYINASNNLGILFGKMGRNSESGAIFQENIRITEKVHGKDHPEYARSCMNLGIVCQNSGQYEKSELLYLESKQVYEKAHGKESPGYSNASFNLAHLYQIIGQYEKAELLFLEGKKLEEKLMGKETINYSSNCIQLGSLYQDMNRLDEAAQLLLEGRTIVEKLLGKEHPHCAMASDLLGIVYIDLGRYKEAEAYLVEAKQVREKVFGKEHPEYSASCGNLGILYNKSGQHQKAEALLLESRELVAKTLGKDHMLYSENCNIMAGFYWGLKEWSKANAMYTESYNVRHEGLKRIFHFTSETEKDAYLEKITRFNMEFLSFASIANPSPNKEFIYDASLSGRNLILTSSQQTRNAIFTKSDSSLKIKYDDWMATRNELAYWYSKPLSERGEYVNTLEEKANTLEKELSRISSIFKDQQLRAEPTWKNIQQRLQPKEASIEFVEVRFNDGFRWTDSTFYIALLIRKESQEPELLRLFEKKELDSVLSFTKSIDKEKTINLRYAQNSSLYKLIWQPLERHLDGVTKIYFAPSGMLHKIPLAALAVNSKERVGDKYRMVQLNSTASVLQPSTESISVSDKLYLYGGVLYDGDTTALRQAAIQYKMKDFASRSLPDDLGRGDVWRYLEGSKAEVENIEKITREKKGLAKLFTGWEATEESVKSLTSKTSPEILHIATHGFFFADPKTKPDKSVATEGRVFRQSGNPLLRSGLTMAGANFAWNGKPVPGIEDGILTAYEVSNMYLPNTKLAVLSACETGLGDLQGSEGVYGLQRAFKMAGVKNLVMSLWDVPDAATAEFMTDFYKKMFGGQTIEDAFYNTQSVMKDKYRNEPYKWAAWILVR